MNKYKEFLIMAEPFNSDILSSVLWELDIQGINEDVNCLKVFSAEESSADKRSIENMLEKLRSEKMLFNFSVEEYLLEDKNWNEEWEKGVNIIHVSSRVVIKPSFKNYDKKNDEIIITIDPKMSFGTGEHETTKLCIKALEKYINKNDKVLDIGTGTGILAIAALKLGAGNAIAIDNDKWCYNNSIENCLLNDVKDNIEIRLSEIRNVEHNDFDLIIANIQKNILSEIGKEVTDKINQEGILILSGLLASDEKDIISIYSRFNFEFLETLAMEEWIALVMKKQ